MRLRYALVLVGTVLLSVGCGSSGEAETGPEGAAGGANDGGALDGAEDQGEGGLGAGGSGGGTGGTGGDGSGGSGGDPSGGTGGDGSGGAGGDSSGGTGGDGSGGSGGGGGGESGGGSVACRVLANLVTSALAEAQKCTSSARCDVHVPGMCCPEVVSSGNPTAIATYTGRLHAYFMACGSPDCTGVVCTSGQAAYCASNGRCELP